MSELVSISDAKDNLMKKDFCKVENKELFYHKKITSVHISEKDICETLKMKDSALKERFSPLKIKHLSFKKLMTCDWSKERYNDVLDEYSNDNNLLLI
jgi:hypothetical protein